MIKFNKEDKILSNIADKFRKRLKTDGDYTLVIDEGMDKLFCTIEDGVVITAGSYGQMLYACGRIIRNPKVRGEFRSHKEYCGIYFATHFGNYLDNAPLEELYDYIDDLAFWGMNRFELWLDIHFYDSMKDPKCQEKVRRTKGMMKHASSIGITTSLVALANEAFDSSPMELRADWTCGHDGYIYPLNDHFQREICPSVPGGMEKIIEYRKEFLEEFRDVQPDEIVFGAYDEGGCSCTKCAPWGSNGYVRCMEALIPVIKEYLPNVRFRASMWQFGTYTGDDREYIAFKKILEDGRLKEIEALTSEPQYARYPYEQGMPRPLINFPEISMYGILLWGGFGSNPLPGLMGDLFKKDGDKMAGGYPYSEGIYEDINKVIMLRLYRDNQAPIDTIREYCEYEYGLKGETLEKVVSAISAMEETTRRKIDQSSDNPHRYPIENPEKIPYIEKIITEADKELSEEVRKSLKWRQTYLRAVIDGELYRNDFTRNDKIMEYYMELMEIYHLENAARHVRPDIDDGPKLKRKLTEEELDRVAKGYDITKFEE